MTFLTLYLYYIKLDTECHVFFAIKFGDRERNRTSPNRWIPLSILSNDIETHGASTVSTPVMPWEVRRFATPSLTLYLYYTKDWTKCQVFFNLFLFNLRATRRVTESSEQPVRWWILYFFPFIFFRSWSHLLSSFFQYFLSSSSVSNRSSGNTDFHDTTFWVSSLRVSNLWRLYPHHDPTVSSTCGTFVTVPPLCRYSSTVSFRCSMFTCSWYG